MLLARPSRWALLIKALQKVVDARTDEREAYYESLLAGSRGTVAVGPAEEMADAQLADAEPVAAPVDAEPVAEPTAPDSVAKKDTPADGQQPDGVTEPTIVTDDSGDVSAGTDCAAGDVAGDVPAETNDLPASLLFELSNTEQRYADALVEVAENYLANGPGPRHRRVGQRYEVVLTIDHNELAEQSAAGDARYYVDPDWGIDEEDARQIACDADLTEFSQDAQGNLLNYERRRPVVPAQLLRALKLRDHNRCRFPGCPHQRYVEAHYVQHWIDGGETRLENLVLLCSAITGCCITVPSTSRSRTIASYSSAGTAK